MLLPLADLQPVDWMNAVIVPVILGIVIGIPLSLYAGLVGSRLVTFQQIKTAALLELNGLPFAVSYDSGREIDMVMHSLLQAPWLSFAAEKQSRAAFRVRAIAQEICAAYENAKAEYAPIGNADFERKELLFFGRLMETEFERDACIAGIASLKIVDVVKRNLAEIQGLRPDIFPIIARGLLK